MWNFEYAAQREELRRQFEVDYTIPSRCAQMLAEGIADIGIIPVAAYATISSLSVLPDVAIASRNSVRSILLISEKPLDQICTVALDSSSRTSAALIQVLFRKHWQRDVQFTQADPSLANMLGNYDAALLIGDPALQVDRVRYQTWDLAEEWRRFTGKPFVFAFWAIRTQGVTDEEAARAAEIFRDSRDAGLRHVDAIAGDWSARLKLPADAIVRYLSDNVHYYLDPENIAGMQLFFEYAAELQVLPHTPELKLVPELEIRNSGPSKSF
jgi:chorismate dehydratase